MKKVFCLVSLCFLTVACPQSVKAQYCWQEDAEPTKLRLDSALEYRIDMQATFFKGQNTPLAQCQSLWFKFSERGECLSKRQFDTTSIHR